MHDQQVVPQRSRELRPSLAMTRQDGGSVDPIAGCERGGDRGARRTWRPASPTGAQFLTPDYRIDHVRRGAASGNISPMIRLSLQARQALAKLTLPVLIVAAFGLMLLGKA